MSDKSNNPHIFPFTEEIEVAGRKTLRTTTGMTLRDYFAGQVAAGWMSTYPNLAAHSQVNEGNVASLAYRVADALLRAREEP